MTECAVLGCERERKARAMCLMHYKRWQTAAQQEPKIFRGTFAGDLKPGPLPEHRPDLGPCWEWSGARNAAGYGVLNKTMFGTRLVHRVALVIASGKLLSGDVMHHCDNPPCARPSHLRDATHQENMSDAAAKGRMFAPRAGQTQCKHGHELTPETTTTYLKEGYTALRCIKCRKASSAQGAAKRKRERHARGLLRARKETK